MLLYSNYAKLKLCMNGGLRKSKKLTECRLVWFYQQVLRLLIGCIALALFVVVLPWSLQGSSGLFRADEAIRVAVVKSAAEVAIDGSEMLVTVDGGIPLALTVPVTLKPSRDGVLVNGRAYREVRFSAAGAVFVNSKPYRGIAEVVRGDGGLTVVNQLPLEEYLVGLINCEISSAWPIDAVKAQAVIARTYALNRKALRQNALYHLESSVIDQVYDGCLIEDSRARRAVQETEGQVLTFGGAIIQAFYHSNCGGSTEAAENVWGASLPYLKGVDCQYCLGSPSGNWEVKISLAELEERLRAAGHKVGGIVDVRQGPFNSRGRLKNIQLVMQRGTLSVGGDQFRKAIGYGVIKSTRFSVRVAKGEAMFAGTGNGHGVGLCQWGAKQRALDGFEYGEILAYYYPGTTLSRLGEAR